jgi:hypothetical protein
MEVRRTLTAAETSIGESVMSSAIELPLQQLVATPRFDPSREIRAPRGSQLSCKNWQIEAAYRMIQNNLDSEVAEAPQSLVVYGGIGRAARNWQCYDEILNRVNLWASSRLTPMLPEC